MKKLPEIRKFIAPEFITGDNVRLLANQYITNFGMENVLIVTDKNVEKLWWYKDIVDGLEENGIMYTIFKNVGINPKDSEVMEGSQVYMESKCDGFLAIGGGSVMDCAKGMAIVSTNGGNILDYKGVDEVYHAIPPLICVPSTAGTSADVSQFSIIRDMGRLVKIAIISKAIVPDVALIDPLTTSTMDPYLTVCTGIDALTHAFEAYVSSGSSIITDNHALNAIKQIHEYLPQRVDNPDDETAQYYMMIASLEAGLAFSNASLGAVHAMAHSLGGLYNFAHGECNALLIDHVSNFNFKSCPEKYKIIGEAIGLDFRGLNSKERQGLLFSYLQKFKKRLGINNTLGEIGTAVDDLSLLCNHSIKDPCILTNPRDANIDDLRAIFLEAM